MADRSGIAVVLCVMVFGIACGADWEPEDPGDSAAMDWNPHALSDGPEIVWKTNVGKGHSAVVVRGNYLYTMGSVKQGSGNGTYSDVVSCLDTETGDVVWQYSYPCKDIYFPGPRATPTLDGEFLYTLSWQGHLFCLSAEDGSVIWSRNLAQKSLARPGHWGLSGSPVVAGDLLILTAGLSGLGLNKTTGEVLWRSAPVETSLPTPVLFNSNGKRLAAIPHDETLYAVDVETGGVEWSFARDKDYFVGPTLVDGKLFMPGTDRTVLLGIDGGNAPFVPLRGNPQVLMKSSRPKFSAHQGYAVVDGYAYGFTGRFLQCVDILTGKREWKRRIGDHGSLSAADGKLIILEGDGTLTLAYASPKGFREISSAKVLELADNRGVPQPQQNHCWTRPVLADGRIYARSNYGDLVSVDVSR
ncbi:MAG: PQQ-binding-like beta-propeller repeat protein [bacterium]|nr:PQQ-binding-like beta-propeller repeat protein [bacterium]